MWVRWAIKWVQARQEQEVLQLQAKSKVCYVGVVGYYSGHYKFLK